MRRIGLIDESLPDLLEALHQLAATEVMGMANPDRGRPVEHCIEVVLSRSPYKETMALVSRVFQ